MNVLLLLVLLAGGMLFPETSRAAEEGVFDGESSKARILDVWLKRIGPIKKIHTETLVRNIPAGHSKSEASSYQFSYWQNQDKYRYDLADIKGKSPAFLARQAFDGQYHQYWLPAEGGYLQISMIVPFEKTWPLYQDGSFKAFAFLNPNQQKPPDVFSGIVPDDFLSVDKWKAWMAKVKTCEKASLDGKDYIKMVFDYMDYQEEGTDSSGKVFMEIYFSNDKWLYPSCLRLVGPKDRLYADFKVTNLAYTDIPYPAKAVSRHFETKDKLTYTMEYTVSQFRVNADEDDDSVYSIDTAFAKLIYDRDNKKTIQVPQ